MKVIIITGTPGTGKTTIAHIIEKMGFQYIDVNKLIDKYSLCDKYDKERKCKTVNPNKLNKVLVKLISTSKKDLVIDSHLSHFLPKRHIDLCITTHCNLKELKHRLEQRGYDKKKVRENLDAEIFDLCTTEAEKLGHTIMAIDTSKKINVRKLMQSIRERL